jgi:hypothetical protein
MRAHEVHSVLRVCRACGLSANTFRVTWNVSSSANGLSFLPIGTIVITFVV